jgi:dipeptidyl aminopeptidase/acylaminoacyl peptidase
MLRARAILPPSPVSAGVLAVLLALPAVAGAAAFPPHLRFRTVSTDRVSVHYHQGLEAMARRTAALATEILADHEQRYGVRAGRVQIVVADVEDDANGFATPLPYPLVHVRAVAPHGNDELGNYHDWLQVLLTHELAHIVHLGEAHGLVRAARHVFGRAPFLFPNATSPTWIVEGLATYEETQDTPFGRGRNPDSIMVLRMAALEDDFPGEDRPVSGLDRWPDGQASYLFGEAFFDDLRERYGADTLPEMARVHSGRLVPFLDELTAKKVTGASFHALWLDWEQRARAAFEEEGERRRSRGLTAATPLTRAGIRQMNPRFSPGGEWLAYTSRILTRYREIRIMRPDGTADRHVADRNGGTALSWTPDGKTLVYDEPEQHRVFAQYSDLRAVDVATGRVRRLTSGTRAKDPDVSPDGRRVVFVRQDLGRSELAVIGLDRRGLRDITASEPGVQWSGPRWSPKGDAIVVSRWRPGGWLDVVLVDPVTGGVTPLVEDRAKDVEPAWMPGGDQVVFRSDRDGVSNLYALRLADRAIMRITNVLGGAFTPDVSPAGDRLAFAEYHARGYDLRLMPLDLSALAAAEPFVDPYPAGRPDPPPVDGDDRPYRPLPLLWPRFWSPSIDRASGETRLGIATAGSDPLFQNAYLFNLYRGSVTDRFGGFGLYQYDRFWPTLLATVENKYEPSTAGSVLHTRELNLTATIPLTRTLRSAQSVSLAWRRSRQTREQTASPRALDLGGLEAAWSLGSVKQYPYSISPVDGARLRLAYLRETPAFGSDLSLGKLYADARAYLRLFVPGDALALRVGGGTTFGEPGFKESYAVGGFPNGSLRDVVATNAAVLRGYPDDAFTGRRVIHANVEYRVPLTRPQRGWRTLPLFLRHLHATAFADTAQAWSGRFQWSAMKTGVGAALGADWSLSPGLPLTATVGVARGVAEKGETQVYFRTGLSF